jgi:hypothetical protein
VTFRDDILIVAAAWGQSTLTLLENKRVCEIHLWLFVDFLAKLQPIDFKVKNATPGRLVKSVIYCCLATLNAKEQFIIYNLWSQCCQRKASRCCGFSVVMVTLNISMCGVTFDTTALKTIWDGTPTVVVVLRSGLLLWYSSWNEQVNHYQIGKLCRKNRLKTCTGYMGGCTVQSQM